MFSPKWFTLTVWMLWRSSGQTFLPCEVCQTWIPPPILKSADIKHTYQLWSEMVWRGWRWAGLKDRNCRSSQPGAKFCFSCYFVTFKNKNFFRTHKAKVSVVFGQTGHNLFWAKHLFGASSSSSSYYSLLSFLKFLCQVKSGEGKQTLRWQKWG